MKKLILILLLLSGLKVNAQQTFSVSGTVTNEKGQVVPGATVFISNSRKMALTNEKGGFIIGQLSAGTYELVVRTLGFTPNVQNITVQKDLTDLKIVLKEDVIALSEVVIKGPSDPNRPSYLKLFTEFFLGKTSNAAKCKILNPDVLRLRFNKQDSVLTASTSDILYIENQSLGYKISYTLTEFRLDYKRNSLDYGGSPFFEELKGTAEQQKEWERKRQIAYEGSTRHFFKAAFNNTAEEEGFLVYQLPSPAVLQKLSKKELAQITPMKVSSMLTDVNKDFKLVKSLTGPNSANMYIIYTKEREPQDFLQTALNVSFPLKTAIKQQKQVSQISALADTVYIDRNGVFNRAKSLSYKGFWTWERMADLVPSDFINIPADNFILPETPELKNLVASIDTFSTRTSSEKVHLHFDKPYYTLGDTIWMKAYVVDAKDNQPSALSNVLYADLIDEKDSVRSTLRLPIDQGLAAGDFTLSANMNEGNYRVRAYTSWMRNFDPDFFFDKSLPVGDAGSRIITSTKYVFATSGTEKMVMADITYSTADHVPVADKEVNYTVQLDSVTILKAKGVTDEKGILKVSFNNKNGTVKPGLITTNLKLDKQDITKLIPVNFKQDLAELDFFPESGQMIENIRSKIAFKALGTEGLGKDASGYIMDKANNKLADFKADHAGMGSFYLTPSPDNEYTAVVKFENTEKRFKLPQAQKIGYVFSVVKADSAKLYIEIATNKDQFKAGNVTLIAQRNGIVQHSSLIAMKQPIVTVSLDKADLPTGIIQLTLFSVSYEPVAERLVFIQHNDPLKMTISTDKPVYATREKVKMALQANDPDNSPALGSFSVAVTDMSKVPSDETNETTILSNLLLSSDLKGYVEKPNYYFSSPSSDKEVQLDNLMLTQGWRRFIWKDVLAGKYPAMPYKAKEGLRVSGTVTNYNNKPVVGAKVTLLFNTGSVVDTTTNEQGQFNFGALAFSLGTSYKALAETQKGDKNVNLRFDKTPPPIKGNKSVNNDEISNTWLQVYVQAQKQKAAEIQSYNSSRGITLQEVTIKTSLTAKWTAKIDSIKKIALEYSSNLNGKGNANQVITFADLQPGCPMFDRCIGQLLIGVTIAIPEDDPRVPEAFISGVRRTNDHAMMVVLDGRSIGKEVNLVNTATISSVEVLRGPNAAVYGIGSSNGVLLITTKHGGPDYDALTDEYKGITPRNPSTKLEVAPQLYFARQFYAPDYTVHPDLRIPDLRTTVYWNPDLATDANGKTTVEYFNPDTPGTYRAVIEGLDTSGNAGRKVYTYTVK